MGRPPLVPAVLKTPFSPRCHPPLPPLGAIHLLGTSGTVPVHPSLGAIHLGRPPGAIRQKGDPRVPSTNLQKAAGSRPRDLGCHPPAFMGCHPPAFHQPSGPLRDFPLISVTGTSLRCRPLNALGYTASGASHQLLSAILALFVPLVSLVSIGIAGATHFFASPVWQN